MNFPLPVCSWRARDPAPTASRVPSREDAHLRLARLLRRQGLHRHARHPGPSLAELRRQRPPRRVAFFLRRQPRLSPPRQRGLPAALCRSLLAARHRLPAGGSGLGRYGHSVRLWGARPV